MSEKEFSEHIGREFWKKFFQLCPDDQHELRFLAITNAEDWKTCACCALNSERRYDRTPPTGFRGSFGPVNARLHGMGILFSELIEKGNFTKAAELYEEIQGLVDAENALPSS